MTSRLAVAAFGIWAALVPAAGAQEIPFNQATALVAPRLPAVLETAGPNQPVSWSDGNSGLSGSIVAAAPTFAGRRMCRAVRYTVQDASERLAVEGERCRDPDGIWGPGRTLDRVAQAPAASPLIRDLQAALRRLFYFDGAVDGVASDALGRAILFFEHDEQVPPDAAPSPNLLELADAAIARIPQPGSCSPDRTVPDGLSAACGTVR